MNCPNHRTCAGKLSALSELNEYYGGTCTKCWCKDLPATKEIMGTCSGCWEHTTCITVCDKRHPICIHCAMRRFHSCLMPKQPFCIACSSPSTDLRPFRDAAARFTTVAADTHASQATVDTVTTYISSVTTAMIHAHDLADVYFAGAFFANLQ